jgi:hypothetical protein
MGTSNPHRIGVDSPNSLVTRQQVDTQDPGQALVTAVFVNNGLIETHTGVDYGTGDVTIGLPLQPIVAGLTLNTVIIDAYGRVVGGSSGTVNTLPDSGVTAGTYGTGAYTGTYTVNTKGILTAASNTLISIPTSQINNLSVWTGSTSLTTTGTVTTGTWHGTVVDVVHGGTGQSTWTVFGVVYADTSTSLNTVTPNTSTSKQFLSMTGTGTVGAVPVWGGLVVANITDIGTWTGSTSITTLGTITTGTWSGTVIAPVSGGTGLTGYAIGDILVGGVSNTLVRLPDAPTGQALLSGGVNAPPLYGQVNLTTTVTGILPIANGGTGTSTGSFLSLNQPAGQVVVGNDSSGLQSFSTLTFNGTGTLVVGTATLQANPDTTGGFALGTGTGSWAWAFGQDTAGNAYVNAGSGDSIYFTVNGVNVGSASASTWNLPALTTSQIVISTGATFSYLSGSPGVVQVNGSGILSTTTMPTDSKVAVSGIDTTSQYLSQKIIAGSGITITSVSTGGSLQMVINARTSTWRPIVYSTVSVYVVQDTDDTVVINSASVSSTTIQLPVPSSAYQGRVVTLQNANSSGTTTVTCPGGTISGLSPSLSAAFGRLQFLCINSGSSFIWLAE